MCSNQWNKCNCSVGAYSPQFCSHRSSHPFANLSCTLAVWNRKQHLAETKCVCSATWSVVRAFFCVCCVCIFWSTYRVICSISSVLYYWIGSLCCFHLHLSFVSSFSLPLPISHALFLVYISHVNYEYHLYIHIILKRQLCEIQFMRNFLCHTFSFQADDYFFYTAVWIHCVCVCVCVQVFRASFRFRILICLHCIHLRASVAEQSWLSTFPLAPSRKGACNCEQKNSHRTRIAHSTHTLCMYMHG